jgi:hypothetical protein
MCIFKIFKRKAPSILPEPTKIDNWKQKQYEENVQSGVSALQNGKDVVICDDSRSFEMACDIKRMFILEYQKQLAESISISNQNGSIKIKINKK